MRPRCAGLALLAALLVAGCGGGDNDTDGTRSYVGRTADVVLYVTWNRDGDELTGALTQGVIDEDEATVQTSRASLTGTISGSGVSLDLRQNDGRSSTLTGTLDGDALALEYLRGGEGVVTVQLERAGGGDFNVALATLRDRVDQAKADALTGAAETSERERVAQQAQAVEDDLSALSAASAAARSAKGPKDTAELARLRRELQAVRDHTRAALRADELSVCSSAAGVQSDVDALEARAAALHGRQASRDSDRASVGEAIDKLREDFIALQSEDPRYLPPDAPTQRIVGRAIDQARRKLRRAGSSSADTGKAVEAILREARALSAQASVRCGAAGT